MILTVMHVQKLRVKELEVVVRMHGVFARGETNDRAAPPAVSRVVDGNLPIMVVDAGIGGDRNLRMSAINTAHFYMQFLVY